MIVADITIHPSLALLSRHHESFLCNQGLDEEKEQWDEAGLELLRTGPSSSPKSIAIPCPGGIASPRQAN